MNAAIASETPLVERLVFFWSNHFTVSVVRGFVGAFEREAIRPRRRPTDQPRPPPRCGARRQMRGDWPGLDRLEEDRDLSVATDARSVVKGVLRDHRNARAQGVPRRDGAEADGLAGARLTLSR
jgi:hypothetical protein